MIKRTHIDHAELLQLGKMLLLDRRATTSNIGFCMSNKGAQKALSRSPRTRYGVLNCFRLSP